MGSASSINARDQKGLLFRALRDGKNVHRKSDLTFEESKIEVQRYRKALRRWIVDANILHHFPLNNSNNDKTTLSSSSTKKGRELTEPITIEQLDLLHSRDKDDDDDRNFFDALGRLPAEFAEELLESNWKAKTVERYYESCRVRRNAAKNIIGFVLPMLSIEDWVPSALVCKNWTAVCRAADASWNIFLYDLIKNTLEPLPMSPSLLLESEEEDEEESDEEEEDEESDNDEYEGGKKEKEDSVGANDNSEEKSEPSIGNNLQSSVSLKQGLNVSNVSNMSNASKKITSMSSNGESNNMKGRHDIQGEDRYSIDSNIIGRTVLEGKSLEEEEKVEGYEEKTEDVSVISNQSHISVTNNSINSSSTFAIEEGKQDEETQDEEKQDKEIAIERSTESKNLSLPSSSILSNQPLSVFTVDVSIALNRWSKMGDREIVAAHISTVKGDHGVNSGNSGNSGWDWSLPIGWITFFEAMSHFLENTSYRTSLWASDSHCCQLSANRTCSFSELRRSQTGLDAQILSFNVTNGALNVLTPSPSSFTDNLQPLPIPLVAASSVEESNIMYSNTIAPYINDKCKKSTSLSKHPSTRSSFTSLLISRVGRLLATQCIHFILEFGSTVDNIDVELFSKFSSICDDYNGQPNRQRKSVYLSSLWIISTEDFSICFDINKAEIHLENDTTGPIALWNEYHLRRTRMNLFGNDIVNEMSRELVAHYMAPTDKGICVTTELSIERYHQLQLLHWVQGCNNDDDDDDKYYYDGGLKDASKTFFTERLSFLMYKEHKRKENELRKIKNEREIRKRKRAEAKAKAKEAKRVKRAEIEKERKRKRQEELENKEEMYENERRIEGNQEGRSFRDIFQNGSREVSGDRSENTTNGWAYLEDDENGEGKKEEYDEKREEYPTPRSNVGVTDGVLGTLGISTPRI
jgi:hypothetical protein